MKGFILYCNGSKGSNVRFQASLHIQKRTKYIYKRQLPKLAVMPQSLSKETQAIQKKKKKEAAKDSMKRKKRQIPFSVKDQSQAGYHQFIPSTQGKVPKYASYHFSDSVLPSHQPKKQKRQRNAIFVYPTPKTKKEDQKKIKDQP